MVVLYGAGLGLAWHYWNVPWTARFTLLFSLKVSLALSIIGHYLLLAYWLTHKRLSAKRALWIRRSILGHMVLIVILAKSLW